MSKRVDPRRRLLDRIPAHAIQQVIALGRKSKKAFPFSQVLSQLWRIRIIVAEQPTVPDALGE